MASFVERESSQESARVDAGAPIRAPRIVHRFLQPILQRFGRGRTWFERLLPPSRQYAVGNSGSACARGLALAHEKIVCAKREWEVTVDALPQFVCLLDGEGRIVRTNRAVEVWRLGDVMSVQGKCLHHVLHPTCSDPACGLKTLWARARAELSRNALVVWEAEDAVLGRYLRVQLRSIHDNASERRGASRLVSVIDDVTELKRAERFLRDTNALLEEQVRQRTADLVSVNRRLRQEIDDRRDAQSALAKSEKRFSYLVETMLEGLAIWDARGRILYVNDSLCRMLGRPREGLLARLASDVIDSAGGTDCLIHCGRYEAQWLRGDGERIAVQVSQQRIDAPDGEFQGCFAVVMDITQRTRSEEALRRSESELKALSVRLLAAQELERKRIAGELHDGINQTLSALKFYVENGLTLFAQGRTESGLNMLHSVVPRIQSAVDEIRRISMDLRPSMLDDLGILATAAWFCREFQGIYTQLRVDTSLQACEQDMCPTVKTVIYRTLQEALNNVVKHAQATHVSVTLVSLESTVELTVEDNGAGFDPGEIANREGYRHGLGLSSMRERAEAAGGRFSIRSVPARGTIIRVVWPRAQAEAR